ncbi:mannonate dehydratase [Candidatus Latescibacterota bacterium]
MKRREFGKVLTAGTIGSAVSLNKTTIAQPKKALMYAGNHQSFRVNDKDLQYLQRFGVTSKIASPTFITDKGWDINEILQWKDKCREYDITLEGLVLPYRAINRPNVPNFMLGNFDKGERETDIFNECIRVASKAGMRLLLLSLKDHENVSTSAGIGRGEYSSRRFNLKEALEKKPPNYYDTPLTEEQNWERITFFLERVIPVATEYKVQIANHPCDPWLPPGFRGIDRVLGGFEGFKKYIEICPSPYHGLLLCLGCFAEACDNPATEVYDHVKYFAERKKIFWVHYRNITGSKNNFMEVFPDEGVVDMFRVAKVLYDAGYPYALDPDHYPRHPDDKGRYQSGAYQYGYINAMIQAVSRS